MKVKEVSALLNARIVCGSHRKEVCVDYGFGSDLMSDVLTLDTNELLLITGLANVQTIRTAEMADIQVILFVRNKKASAEMIELARENDLVILESPYSLFKASGILFSKGLKPIF